MKKYKHILKNLQGEERAFHMSESIDDPFFNDYAQKFGIVSGCKPERVIIDGVEPYSEDDVLERIPATDDEPAKVRLRAQYIVEVEDITAELQEKDKQELRKERNKKLSECDWTQMADTPLSESEKLAWADYRQALRDLPQDQPDATLSDVSWPNKPGV